MSKPTDYKRLWRAGQIEMLELKKQMAFTQQVIKSLVTGKLSIKKLKEMVGVK